MVSNYSEQEYQTIPRPADSQISIDSFRQSVAAIEQGFIQKEIQESAYAYQRAVESGDQIVVGLNKFQQEESPYLDHLM